MGENIENAQSEDSREVWSMPCVDYIKGAIRNVNDMLEKDKVAMTMFGDRHSPYSPSYRPEMDVSELLSDTLINRYQQLIGMLRWSIELGRIDIQTEVSCLSQHLCEPRKGHLNAVYLIFRYLQKNIGKNLGRIVFDPLMEYDDENIFNGPLDKEEWVDFYPNASEAMPRNTLEPFGNPVLVRAWVDVNHAGNLANRRSHSGILIYVNNALVLSFSKR